MPNEELRPLIAGWEAVKAADGRTYWWNVDTRETTWTRGRAEGQIAAVQPTSHLDPAAMAAESALIRQKDVEEAASKALESSRRRAAEADAEAEEKNKGLANAVRGNQRQYRGVSSTGHVEALEHQGDGWTGAKALQSYYDGAWRAKVSASAQRTLDGLADPPLAGEVGKKSATAKRAEEREAYLMAALHEPLDSDEAEKWRRKPWLNTSGSSVIMNANVVRDTADAVETTAPGPGEAKSGVGSGPGWGGVFTGVSGGGKSRRNKRLGRSRRLGGRRSRRLGVRRSRRLGGRRTKRLGVRRSGVRRSRRLGGRRLRVGRK